ncbi:Cof-type HAD-IIB family hydrolase [Bacillus solimangrovi]|uniref:Hydrolase n=1 Tax=Bacillus solimangrovi TaxID=1305675 RepID=A0A1E5LJB3_9BACI|nr:Cof-type HAD-IIB family hydrolase [Bacillus solimangrovi]OEH94183.1 hypothetical protein BFG57_09025 [Bacillus solimangrovi]
MQIQAVVLDLDGTLLNSNKQVSERNMSELNRMIESGMPIIIATARPPRAVKRFLPDEILASSIMVYYNGAMIVNEHLKLNEHYSISSQLSSRIIDYLIEHEPKHWFSIEVEDEWYCFQEIDYTSMMNITSNPKQIDLTRVREVHPTKILVSNLDSIESFTREFEQVCTVITTDSNSLTQIMRRDVSKETAISLLSRLLDISLERIAVFGDDYNDIGLFKACGYPIAMGNAIPQLKDIAYHITDTNDDDGVAVVLESIVNERNIKK